MKIFVISLIDSLGRRERVKEELSCVDFEFFDAVNGYLGLPDELENKVNDTHRKIFRSRPLTPGERGVYASHYQLWERCVELGVPIVILEDDFKKTQYFKNVIEHLSVLAEEYDYVRLEPQFTKGSSIGFDGAVEKVLWLDNSKGATGYMVTPQGAEKFLNASRQWKCSVDNFISETYLHGVPSVGIIPYAIYAPNDMESTIQGKAKLSKVPLLFKLTRELYRFYRFILMLLWNRKMYKKLKC
ncbi:glycosyltransferase family 25 protein [Vibrio marisflavi]|uniref:Glycosyl transferase family 25 domain-containing protein n=1 Tax=Vibrio marisflavi CECT 7928 TaxID=634439 RepID=A0ABM9A9S4_9VIBR|nr:glycosyltransferase family 25 protein [Vibrio marisflavi]CAH0541792.1 hypothetical protein VMF7928_03838 [Vibrio marisflavi CECT 7928]